MNQSSQYDAVFFTDLMAGCDPAADVMPDLIQPSIIFRTSASSEDGYAGQARV
jgi:hypothetical protein